MTNRLLWKSKFVQVSVLTCGALLSGCAMHNNDQQKNLCQVGSPMAETTLYFGMSRPHGPNITQKQWQTFVDKEVTPRFQDGLTVFNANGQWLGNDGKVAKESSRALMLIHDVHDAKTDSSIETLRQLYKKQFAQESVMRVDAVKCVSF